MSKDRSTELFFHPIMFAIYSVIEPASEIARQRALLEAQRRGVPFCVAEGAIIEAGTKFISEQLECLLTDLAEDRKREKKDLIPYTADELDALRLKVRSSLIQVFRSHVHTASNRYHQLEREVDKFDQARPDVAEQVADTEIVMKVRRCPAIPWDAPIDCVLAIVNRLPPRQKTLMRAYAKGSSAATLARTMGVSLRDVLKDIADTRRRIRAGLSVG